MATFKVKAVYEYTSGHEDDLKFAVGQIITITDQDDADWYGGEYVDEAGNKQEGIFPRNFVEKYEPTAPPRPSRTRPKSTLPASNEDRNGEAGAQVPASSNAPPPPEASAGEDSGDRSMPSSLASPPQPPPTTAAAAESKATPPPVQKPALETPLPSSPPAVGRTQPGGGAKGPPPPVSEKPSSFRDRIAAFNKPAAPPVAPFKPSGLSGAGGANFVKKPFVAPPPSRNSYIPPQREAPVAKLYRRDEDPEVKEMEAEAQENAERAGLLPGKAAEGDDGDEPKPTSLKERIALLQKQQLEASQRQAELAAKKDKPKKPAMSQRSMSQERGDGNVVQEDVPVPPLPQTETRADAEPAARMSVDEPRPSSSHRQNQQQQQQQQLLHTHRRTPSKSVQSDAGGGEGPEEPASITTAEPDTASMDERVEKDDNDKDSGAVAETIAASPHNVPADNEDELGDQDEGGDEDEEDVDPEVRRKEELRARMAKMSGGMGMPGMFGMVPLSAPPPPPPKKKKSIASVTSTSPDQEEEPMSRAPPVPSIMALAGMSGRQAEDPAREKQASAPMPRPVSRGDEAGRKTPEATGRKSMEAPPPVPGGRPAPPPVPSDVRSPPPVTTAELNSQRSGDESDDELSERAPECLPESLYSDMPPRLRSPPPPLPQSSGFVGAMGSQPPVSTPLGEDYTSPPTSPRVGRRDSRPPPPIPGSGQPFPIMSRPPPPPPPPPAPAPVRGELSRQSTADGQLASPFRITSTRPTPGEFFESGDGVGVGIGKGEVTEYEGDYDTDIASSAPHKDALKSQHGRGLSVDDLGPLSPGSEIYPPGPPPPPPPPPTSAAPRVAPPPMPAQPPPETSRRSSDARRSLDAPRMAPPPPPPPPQSGGAKEADELEPSGFAPKTAAGPGFVLAPKIDEEEDTDLNSWSGAAAPAPMSPTQSRGPPPPPSSSHAPSGPTANWAGRRQSFDVGKMGASPSVARVSQDMARPSVDFGFIAEDVDLALHSGWWKQSNQVPPCFQNRRDVYYESTESTSTNGGTKTVMTRETRVLFIDYSQTIITVRFDPYDQQDVDVSQRHEPPPRALRQDQLEQAYERYGRHIAEAVAGKSNTLVGDGTPLGLVHELLRPWKDVLPPVGTRGFGALVYANLANASTLQNDEIRKGDIITIRNSRFQGKHGPMHKYSMEVGKPDHVAVVGEWDGTKKKVRVWEQGRESKKVKLESFKLDDLRSGEVKVWRVMSRGWVGWTVQP